MTDPRQAFLAEARERGSDPAAEAALERVLARLRTPASEGGPGVIRAT